MLGSQIVALSWEVLECSGGGKKLREVGHWEEGPWEYLVLGPFLSLCFLSYMK
jgi:hypothetical protein